MVNFKIAAIALLLMTSGASAQQYYPQQPYGFGYQGYGYQGFGYLRLRPRDGGAASTIPAGVRQGLRILFSNARL
jgi:hypothetical protein